MKKILILLTITLSFAGCSLFKKKDKTPEKKPPIDEPVNIIETSERPYTTLTPKQSGGGWQLLLAINTLPKDADELEYDLEYQSGTLLQGVFDSIDFSSDPVPTEKAILLGTCSTGGKCSYHEDITSGTTILRFRGPQNYVLKNEWRFFETKEADGQFSSQDGKFQLEAGKVLNSSKAVIVTQTSGLPELPEGKLLSEPYALLATSGLPKGTATLTMRASEESENMLILGWDGEAWQEFEPETKGKQAVAEVDLLESYVLVGR